MANTIASIFGPSAEQLEYERQLEEQKRRDDMYATTLAGLRGDIPGFATGYALGYQGGEGLGQAIQGIFGAEPAKDPRLARARKSREIISKYGAGAFNDPTLLTQMANEMAESDMLDEAFALQNTANELRKNVPEQFITATGEQLMAADPAKYSGLNKKATYQVSTKTGKADELIKAKDADVPEGEKAIPQGVQNVRVAATDALNLLDLEEKEGGYINAVSGKGGYLKRLVPIARAGSSALAFSESLLTLKGNVGFDRLKQMRDESKTGGALGNVSEKELAQLNASLASLNPDLDSTVIRRNINQVLEVYNGILKKFTPQTLQQYGYSPELSGYNWDGSVKTPNQKSIDVSGKVKSSNTGSIVERFNILNQLNQ